MKPVFQTRFGKEGNCWAACLASLFEVPLEEVDHCSGNHEDWLQNTTKWLAARGWYYLELTFPRDGQIKCTAPPDGQLLICGCVTERGLNHAVIGEIHITDRHDDGQVKSYDVYVAHDPIPGGSKEIKINALMLICPIYLTRMQLT